MLEFIEIFGRANPSDVDRVRVKNDRLVFWFRSGVKIIVPWGVVSERLESATARARADFIHDRDRQCLCWDSLDEQVSIKHLLDYALHHEPQSDRARAEALRRDLHRLTTRDRAEDRIDAALPVIGGRKFGGYLRRHALDEDRRIADLDQRLKLLEARLYLEPR